MFEVSNQPPPLEPYNLFASDIVLREAVRREGAAGRKTSCRRSATAWANPEGSRSASTANRNTPQLQTYDRFGHRLDEVEFHQAWHDLLHIACSVGLHSGPVA